jgi:ABC-type transport system substrate-binding protein
MKRFVWQWLVVSSVLVASVVAETRPQYGGTIRVAMREALTSLDPADSAQLDSFARRNLTMLMFDTLVSVTENGRLQPSLATSWQASGNQGWKLQLRRGVKFHDGSSLTAEVAAASLRAANPSWNVSTDGDTVVIDPGTVDPELLTKLALPRNAIVKRDSASTLSGTGPFHIADWQPGKTLTLAAQEDCWRGRTFVDGVEIELGRSYRDQIASLDLGRVDLIEVAPEQVHRASMDGRWLASSSPVELIALVFSREASSPEEKLLREALALSIERNSMRSVLLQGAGQPAGSLLPTWMSGYGFVFPVDADLAKARHDREQVSAVPTWTLGYDGNDAVARLVAERIALNAKDAGLSLHTTSTATSDLRLMRIPLSSADPWIALADVAALVNAPTSRKAGPVENLYAAEQSLMATQKIIPLFHLPLSYAGSATLKNWTIRPDGKWNLADAWVGSK